MDTIKIDKKNVLMIAHRGVSGIEKENTKEAFILAGNKSYFGIETDVHVTLDGKFLICHDDNISRITGIDMVIEENKFEDIVKHKIYKFNSEINELEFPTLSEYINICKKYNKVAVLEIKNDVSEENAVEIIETIKMIGWLKNTIVISFSMCNLLNIRKHYKDVNVQFLTGEFNDNIYTTLVENNFSLDYYYPNLTKEIVDKMHKHNLMVNCWTVDEEIDALKLIELGVDMITSNILE